MWSVIGQHARNHMGSTTYAVSFRTTLIVSLGRSDALIQHMFCVLLHVFSGHCPILCEAKVLIAQWEFRLDLCKPRHIVGMILVQSCG